MTIHAPSPRTIWLVLFGIWGVFLSGVLVGLGGPPGALQAIRLNGLLSSKQAQLARLEVDIGRLEAEGTRIEKNRFAQEREIRRVLGYAAQDELIFDFTADTGE